MICKSFWVEAAASGSVATDFVFNLMEYDKSIHTQSGRVAISNGVSMTGNMTVDAVSKDYMVKSSEAYSVVLAGNSAKAYILWATYPVQSTVFPSRRPSVRWQYGYSRKA